MGVFEIIYAIDSIVQEFLKHLETSVVVFVLYGRT